MPVEEYAAALRARLPDHDIAVARTPSEERELIEHAPVVTGGVIDEELLDAAENLELFACVYAGYNHLPLEKLAARDIAVTTASGVHGPNIGEHVVGSMLALARSFPEGWRRQQTREWRHYETRELKGSTVTIVGLGAIGTAVTERLQGFDVTTLGVRYSPEKGGPTDEVVGFDDLHEALARTDYLVLACPLTEETRGLIGREAFATLPPEAVLVNVARGPVVDTDAMVRAIRLGKLRGAALDVTDPEPLPADHPLWGFSNVIISPHNAGHTPAYYERLGDIVARNLQTVAETGRYETLENQVR
ncbi:MULTISPECIES: D-2-hydroxyacid dehydrogenase [unclassified Haladaptatus]|uniref:D-2-hydroxyacid dehydrogenase n=1 Tax=unclassified Haladaptatus TaxID=2622732 RepID=UPI0023E8E675|nr:MULTISPECIES: D-2-hydroxyacid dehydrogenase [unclassified Haladaptatus]